MRPRVSLYPNAGRKLRNFYPWAFHDDIADVQGDPEPGAIVLVRICTTSPSPYRSTMRPGRLSASPWTRRTALAPRTSRRRAAASIRRRRNHPASRRSSLRARRADAGCFSIFHRTGARAHFLRYAGTTPLVP